MTTQPVTMGDDDLDWVYDHMEELGEHEGKWIAVIGQRIVGSACTVDEVIDQVERQGLTDPFITKIPDDVHRKVYFIG